MSIIMTNGVVCCFASCAEDMEIKTAQGWRELTEKEITSADMRGYENIISPANTVVNADGSITFTPPEPPSTDELFSRLRVERDTRISAVLWMRERHADELELGKETSLTPEQYTALLTYIQALRDIPAQPGAPWDGGGSKTPWPHLKDNSYDILQKIS